MRFLQLRGGLGMVALAALIFALLTLAFPRGQAVAVSQQPIFELANTTIISGASLGAAVDLGGARLAAITMPPTWTTANLSIQASPECINYYNAYDDGGREITVTVAAGRYVVFDDPTNWEGVRCIKIRSGTQASAVAQGGNRTLTLTVRYER